GVGPRPTAGLPRYEQQLPPLERRRPGRLLLRAAYRLSAAGAVEHGEFDLRGCVRSLAGPEDRARRARLGMGRAARLAAGRELERLEERGAASAAQAVGVRA